MTYTIEQAHKKIMKEWKPSAPTIVYDRMETVKLDDGYYHVKKYWLNGDVTVTPYGWKDRRQAEEYIMYVMEEKGKK